MLFFSSAVYAQNSRMVKGLVVDSNNESIIGATVRLKENASIGTVTDINGNFSISISDNNQTLVISYLGMITQEVNIAGKNQLTIVMQEDAKQLEEVVVVGYGKQKKESVVGAIVQTSGQVLERAGGVSSIGAALTGNVPGVITTSSTGMPGDEDPHILIRGQSTWNNSNPLILVDGIERPMNSVEISSVESISVLKDASATAVYGVKGANGVIIITTKRGREGKATVNIGFDATMKSPSKLPRKYDSYDALNLRNKVIEREMGLTPASWDNYMPQDILNKYRHPANLEESERYPNVDWADVMFEDYVMSYNSNVNVSGGTSFVKYFASADILHEGDIFKEWDNRRGYQAGYGFNRINVRSNLDFQLTRSTSFSVNLSGSQGERKTPWGATGAEYDIWQGAYAVPPDAMLPQYADGTWGYYPADKVGAVNSVINLARSGLMKKSTSRINTDFTLSQDLSMFVKGLNAKGTLSMDNEFIETERGINDLYNDPQAKWIDPDTGEVFYDKNMDGSMFDYQESIKWSPQGGFLDNGATYRKLFYQLQLNYGVTLGKHDITAMGVFNREEYAKGSEIPHYREDWVFRTTYNFAKKYFVEFNGAYNGSEKFSKDYRFEFFPSGAAGWMLSEEKFMEPLEFLDMLKFRASYGKIGDDNVNGRWLYMDQWAYGGNSKMGENNSDRSPYTYYRETTVGNANVHWETATKTNFGADFSFINGLVSGTVDVFNDYRTEILLDGGGRAVPSYYGTTAPVANLGRVRVKGYEIDLKFNYKFNNGLRLWATANMTHAKDKILDADDPALYYDYQKKQDKQIGQAYSYIDHGYYNTWDELYASTIQNTNDNHKMPGNYYIVDYNGDGLIDKDDNIPYGFPDRPQNTYNSTLGFEWKGFGAFIQFYGVNNVTRQVVFTSFPNNRLNIAYDQGSYWTKDNTGPDVPLPRRLTGKDDSMYGSLYMYDGSYIRLKNAEIAYTFDSGWIKKLGLQSLRIYANGNNLWLWTRMPDDRESNFAATGWASQGAYPTVRRYNLGINITL
ncbi:MAG: TonB-dependent receptor [Dysgonamonadaceae bacterium]|nr:TonB-dependent receptor [Dysgonamonadaceae bacterium]